VSFFSVSSTIFTIVFFLVVGAYKGDFRRGGYMGHETICKQN